MTQWFLMVAMAAGVPGSEDGELRLGEPVVLQIWDGDPVLEGHGPYAEAWYVPDFRGTLHAWASPASVASMIRVEAGPDAAEDDGSGGRRMPCVHFPVEPGVKVWVLVSTTRPEEMTEVEVRITATVETDQTRNAAAAMREAVQRARSLHGAGKPREARALLDQTLAMLPAVDGARRSLALIGATNHLIRFAAELRLNDTVATAFRWVLEYRERILPPDHPDVGMSLNNLGSTLGQLGEYDKARPLLERALSILRRVRSPLDPLLVMTLSNLALLYSQLGEDETARVLFEQALDACEKGQGPEHPETARILSGLAETCASLGEHATALALSERSVAIWEKTHGPEHPQTAIGINNLAQAHAALGDIATAIRLHEQTLAIREKTLGPWDPMTANNLRNLAEAYRTTLDYDRAREYFERAHLIFEDSLGPGHPFTTEALRGLAVVMADLGDVPRALELVGRATPGRREHLQRVMGGLTESEKHEYLTERRVLLEFQLSLSASGSPEVQERAYNELLSWKGRIARSLVASREQLARGLDGEQREIIQQLRGTQGRLSNLLSGVGSSASKDQLAALHEERNTLELRLERTLGGIEDDPAISLKDLQAVLPAGAAVLDFFVQRIYRPTKWGNGRPVQPGRWDEKHVICWIVRPGGAPLMRVDLGPAAALASAVRDDLDQLVTRRGITVRQPGRSVAPEELRRSLWDPLAGSLAGIDTVFVSPDSFLGTLPLGTLRLSDGDYLIERKGFVYLQDLSTLAREDPSSRTSDRSLLSMGGVDFSQRAENTSEVEGKGRSALRDGATHRWDPLPASKHESEVVLAMHAESFGTGVERLLLQGEQPTEERLKLELGRYSVLHLATHGFFHAGGAPGKPDSTERSSEERRNDQEARKVLSRYPGLLSGLVCAGANRPAEDERDDGYLTAEEVGWLDLTGVELVVMSACETGLGRARSGEGLIGLRRAFQTAGAATIISSLWSVGDESTAALMRDFYDNLFRKGLGPQEALRAAQLAMLQRNRAESGEGLPSTWGAFVLSGEWR